MVNTVTNDAAWSGEADCSICKLRDTVLFSGLREDDFEHIHKPIEQTVLAPGTILYRAGDKAEHLFTIRSGLVKLVSDIAQWRDWSRDNTAFEYFDYPKNSSGEVVRG